MSNSFLEGIICMLIIYNTCAEFIVLGVILGENLGLKQSLIEHFCVFKEVHTVLELVAFIGYIPMWFLFTIILAIFTLFWSLLGNILKKIFLYKFR